MPEPFKILLIEDDPDDIDFLREAFKDNGVDVDLEILMRGDLITKWLISDSSVPHLIVMDLNLPKLHGREVLCLIRENKKFIKVPIVVLTTSSLEEDKEYCFKKGADKFISKPSSPEGFDELVKSLVKTVKNKAV
jgi:CheY-like chemotaxis protein